MLPQRRGVLQIAARARDRFVDEPLAEPEQLRFAPPERADRRVVVLDRRRIVQIHPRQLAVARRERIEIRMPWPARAQQPDTARQRVRQERGERIIRARRGVVLVEPVDQQHQAIAARHQLASRHPAQQIGQPRLRRCIRIALRRVTRLDLRGERAHDLRRLVPAIEPAADEVVRHDPAGRLAPLQPRRQDRALAHAGPTGHHDPAVGLAVDQQPIELREHGLAADEALVPLPFDPVVEPLSGHRFPTRKVTDNRVDGSC